MHLSHIGYPLAGDDKYGDFAWNKALAREGLRRMFLHATSLRFLHPFTHEAVTFDAPLPPELAGFVERLGAPA